MTNFRIVDNVRTPYWAFVIGCAGLTAFLMSSYPGSPLTFVSFSICYFSLIALAAPRPRLYGYTFLSALLFLGFWTKVVLHSVWSPEFVDPVGDYAGTAAEWDAALVVASCGAVGVMIPRLLHLFLARRSSALATAASPGSFPAWYPRWREEIWIATILIVAVSNILNLRLAFHQVGANPKLLLPFHLHIVVAWLINVGFSLIISMLIFWDVRSGTGSFAKRLAAAIMEAFCSSISSMSRLAYLLHTGPYFVAILEKSPLLRSTLTLRNALYLVFAFVLAFWLSIVAVFWLRANDYYPYAENVPSHDSVSKHMERTMRSQLPQLFVQRWVGLEGVLAVGALKERNQQLLVNAFTENPDAGTHSLYQRISKLFYSSKAPDKFTFLSNAGPIALLFFSGSLMVVMLGMSLITLGVFATEWLAVRWVGNALFVAVAAAALANVVCQMTFPYLSVIFLLQLCLAIGFFAILQAIPLGPGARTEASGARAR
ncbi:MAG: hypothetical protein JWR21_3760 [Herminiimonas sp.]|nr:hypothetical protein [Herminiimonas sp.]